LHRQEQYVGVGGEGGYTFCTVNKTYIHTYIHTYIYIFILFYFIFCKPISACVCEAQKMRVFKYKVLWGEIVPKREEENRKFKKLTYCTLHKILVGHSN